MGLKDYNYKAVKHSARQYVVGAVHTNTIEGFWSIFKRGIVGSYHKVSRKYLPLYIAECEFKYNNRFNVDILGRRLRDASIYVPLWHSKKTSLKGSAFQQLKIGRRQSLFCQRV